MRFFAETGQENCTVVTLFFSAAGKSRTCVTEENFIGALGGEKWDLSRQIAVVKIYNETYPASAVGSIFICLFTQAGFVFTTAS